MLTTAIRIDPFQSSDVLHPASRVNYAKTYTIEHKVKVKPYGTVNSQFMHHLLKQWTEVIMRAYNPAQNAFSTVSPANLVELGFTPEMINAVLIMMKPRPKGPRADARTSITSVARRSAKEELEADEDEDASEAKILANEADAEKLANRVVELILAGMTYTQALGHVRQLNDNGNGYEGENDAVSEGYDDDDDDDSDDDDDDEEDEQEDEDEAVEDDSERQ
jgi:hypothetical protein